MGIKNFMTLRSYKIVLVLEVMLFVASVGALSYFAENNKWTSFTITLIVCAFLFILLKLSDSKYIRKMLEDRERENNRLLDKFKLYGISDIFNMQNRGEQEERNNITRTVLKEGNFFSLLSLSAASYIDPAIQRHWSSLKARLDEGSVLRLLLINPLSKEKKIRDLVNQTDADVDRKFPLNYLKPLITNYPNVDIRLTSECPYCAIFFSEKEMIYDPYHLGKIGERIENHFIALRLRKDATVPVGNSYYIILRNHFEYLWSNAEKFDDFMLNILKESVSKS